MLKNELESKHDLNRIITVKDELGTIDKLMVSIQNKMCKKAKYTQILIKMCTDELMMDFKQFNEFESALIHVIQ